MNKPAALAPILTLVFIWFSLVPSAQAAADCDGDWQRARLTHYTSYPEIGSEECTEYNGCKWAGMFYGVNGKKPKDWVARHNIAAVHSKHWRSFGNKVLRLRQGTRQIDVQVLDLCSDADCNGCCSQNLGGDGFLVDLEHHTMARFGSGSGIVDFQVCN